MKRGYVQNGFQMLGRERFIVVAGAIFLLVAMAIPAYALHIAQLSPTRNFRLKLIVISGNRAFSTSALTAVMRTKERPFYKFWMKRPRFYPEVFTDDLTRLRDYYRVHGYYQARISYDLKVDHDFVTADINIKEGKPVRVDSIKVVMTGAAPPPAALAPGVKPPLKKNDIFSQEKYQAGDQQLRDIYLTNGYAHALVKRRARVYVGPRRADIRYTVDPGVRAVFGKTTVVGTRKVNPRVVLRELNYKRGERFSSAKIQKSRARIVALNLFSAVEFVPRLNRANPKVVPIEIRVHEKPKHDISIAAGYNTETQFNGRVAWSDYNWLGGGRQLTLSATYSNVYSYLDLKMLQPYLYTRKLSGVLEWRLDEESYQTYTMYAPRFDPYLRYQFTPALSGYLGYRLEYLKFNSVAPSTIAALGGIRPQGILSGPDLGVLLNTTENPLNPQHGAIVTFDANLASHALGGDYRCYRMVAEARKYTLLGWNTVLANRLKLGLADTLGPHRDIPLSERFYSGGEGSVRGYGLRRIGPLSAANDPLGGLSLIEASAELRHPIYRKFSGAIFLDAGQVSLHSYDIPVDSLVFGYGPAVSYDSPVGPIRLDLGFPSKTPRGDPNWQVYFSIGQFY
ncbi:MAG: BamA/OMP85 family outer membrane protein [Candidatus Binataceae bacterium]